MGAFICSIMTTSAMAQSLTVTQQRQFNLDALRTIETYEECAALRGTSSRMDFEMLFTDRKLSIYNDLNGFSGAPTLTVSSYSELATTKGKSFSVNIKNLKKGEPYRDGGSWKMEVTFDKEIAYTNKCGILFSSNHYYGADHHMKATLVWDPETRECQICQLEGSIESEAKPLPTDYSILNQTDDRDYQLQVDGSQLTFNSFGQAFLSAHPEFFYPDDDIVIKVIQDKSEAGCNMIHLKYVPKPWRIKAHVDITMGEYWANDSETETTSSGMEFGVDAGYIFPAKSNWKIGAFLGVGLAQSSMDLDYAGGSYNYNASGDADIDGDSYIRYYNFSNMKQTFKSTDLVVPVYADLSYRINKRFSAYVDAGLKMYFNMKNEVSGLEGTYSTWGYFPEYGFEMRPEDSWNGKPIDGFVTNASLGVANQNASSIGMNGFSMDLMGRLGFRIVLYKMISLDLSGTYQTSLISPFESDATQVSYNASGNISKTQAPLTYTVADGEQARPMVEGFGSLSRKILSVNAGLIVKF